MRTANHILYVQEKAFAGNKEIANGNLKDLRKQGKLLACDNYKVFIQYSPQHRRKTGMVSETI